MLLSPKVTGLLIVASVLLCAVKTNGLEPSYLDKLTSIAANSLSGELQERCTTYETTLRRSLPTDQQAKVSRAELFDKVLTEVTNKKFASLDDRRVEADIKQCIASAPAPTTVSTQTSASSRTSSPSRISASSRASAQDSTSAIAYATATTGKYGTTVQNSEQEAQSLPMFDQGDIVVLSQANVDTGRKKLEDRCRKLEETLRLILKRTRPGLASASTLDVQRAAIEALESRSSPVRDNQPVLDTLRDCVKNAASFSYPEVDSTKATPNLDVLSQREANRLPETPTARSEDPIVGYESVKSRLKKFGEGLYDESDSASSTNGRYTDTASRANNYQPRQTPSRPLAPRFVKSGNQEQQQQRPQPRQKQQQTDSNIQAMVDQLQRTQEQLIKQHNEKLRQLENELAQEREIGEDRERVIDELTQRLNECYEDLLEERRLSSERDAITADLRERLSDAEQAYFELKDASPQVYGHGEESQGSYAAGGTELRYNGQSGGALAEATRETLTRLAYESEVFKSDLDQLVSKLKPAKAPENSLERIRVQKLKLINKRTDDYQKVLREHLEAALSNLVALEAEQYEPTVGQRVTGDDDDDENDDDDDSDGDDEDYSKGAKQYKKKEAKKNLRDLAKVYEGAEDIARKLQEKMNIDELPAHRCQKYYLALNYPGKVTKQLIKNLAKLALPETTISDPEYYNNLSRYVPILAASKYKKARSAAQHIDYCIDEYEQSSAGFDGSWSSQEQLEPIEPIDSKVPSRRRRYKRSKPAYNGISLPGFQLGDNQVYPEAGDWHHHY